MSESHWYRTMPDVSDCYCSHRVWAPHEDEPVNNIGNRRIADPPFLPWNIFYLKSVTRYASWCAIHYNHSRFSVAVAKGPVDLQESWWRGLVDAYQDYQNVMGYAPEFARFWQCGDWFRPIFDLQWNILSYMNTVLYEWQTLTQIMGCYLTEPSHKLGQMLT